ncbi:MAG: cysteine--tRNA ligase [Verrucomicrobia bacterium]|nr:cysteine--tRNA ligase [Verrucomicrobiota bacterium]
MSSKKHLKLFNTESREKEEIIPPHGRPLRIYTCGPTVYNFAHIGNFRTYVFEDLMRRTFKFFGYKVEQVMNITDVDDKTIKGAIREGISLDSYTQPYTEAFFQDLRTLNIEPVEHYPRATDYIPEMISIIQKLEERGIAYRGQDGSVYFAIDKFPSYGRLSHLHLGELEAGASQRIANDEYDKENISDFVLWKAYDPERDGMIYWESPFGKGRPGWHIECSAMAMKILGETLDIHVGGVDNIFPHHENEIAQSEAYSCCRFVKHWLHAEHLLVDHKKMSKSLGNFFTLRDLIEKGYSGREVRYMLLQAHYRTQLNFTMHGMDGAVATLKRLKDFVLRLRLIRKEKLHKAIDLILEKALPETPQKKAICERILCDLQAVKGRDILEPSVLDPILNRSLAFDSNRPQLVKRILSEVKEEKERLVLKPILEKRLTQKESAPLVLTSLIRDVRDEKGSDLLDPDLIKPLLQRIPIQKGEMDLILHDMKVKKRCGFALPILQKSMDQFMWHLADDLNISPALAAVFDMVREINTLCDQGQVGISEAEDVLDFLKKIDEVLGVIPLEEKEEEISPELASALERREEARRAKNWQVADECRAFILAKGYLIEDTAQGPRLKKKGS